MTDKRRQRGAALIIALAIMVVLLAIGLTFFAVSRIESDTASNVVSAVRAEHLVDAGFAIAQHQLNKDLEYHPGATSTDHGWRTLFTGLAYFGKEWIFENPGDPRQTSLPKFSLDHVERALRASDARFQNSLIYAVFGAVNPGTGLFEANYAEPLFRGLRTRPWLEVPRWQGRNILLYAPESEMRLAHNDGNGVDNGTVLTDTEVNDMLANAGSDIRFTRFTAGVSGAFPLITPAFYGTARGLSGADNYYAAEVVDRIADTDTDGDGLRDAMWVPLPKDVDLSRDGIDNDLDLLVDNPRTPTGSDPYQQADSEGNPRNNFEPGIFAYRLGRDGSVVRNFREELERNNIIQPGDPAYNASFRLTVPLPGMMIPVDLNSDGTLNELDEIGGIPAYVTLPPVILLNTAENPGVPVQLTMANVDAADNDHDLFINGFSVYASNGSTEASRRRGFREMNPAVFNAGVLSLSNNAAGAVNTANLVISCSGEPVCEIIGRAAVQMLDESAKANLNASGGHRFDYYTAPGGGVYPVSVRAMNQALSPLEYETRMLPGLGPVYAAEFWGMLAGAGYVTNRDANEWDYTIPGVAKPDPALMPPSVAAFRLDAGLPGLGRVDDNRNALILAFSRLDEDGDGMVDTGAWLPDTSAAARAAIASGVTDLSGIPGGALVGPEIGKLSAYYRMLGWFEGFDEPGELQRLRPLRNGLAESNGVDDNNDGTVDEIGEAGDHLLGTNRELARNVNFPLGGARFAKLDRVTTANSDSRNVTYLETGLGLRAFNKIDPNLATPLQAAAVLMIKGGFQSVNQLAEAKGLQLFPDHDAAGDPGYSSDILFLSGLRQGGLSLRGAMLGESNFRLQADPQLRTLQIAANLADSRDADAVRSLLVTERAPTTPYTEYYRGNTNVGLNPPEEPLNERELVQPGDLFPLGEIQEYLQGSLNISRDTQRLTNLDNWWRAVTAPDPTNFNVPGYEDRVISYAAAGAEAVRINEIMARPVRRVEAEITPNPLAANYAINLDPAPYPGMPGFNMAVDGAISTATPITESVWTLASVFDVFDNSTTPPTRTAKNPLIGKETGYYYVSPSSWAYPFVGNTDIIEFQFSRSTGLPDGRYYLTANLTLPGGVTTADLVDGAFEYTVKYYKSGDDTTYGINEALQIILNIPNTFPDPVSGINYDLSAARPKLLQAFYANYWHDLKGEWISGIDPATGIQRKGMAPGWAFLPAQDNKGAVTTAGFTSDENDGLNAYLSSLASPVSWDDFRADLNSGFGRDSLLAGGADAPAFGSRTFTVVVPSDIAEYDVLCVALRVKPVAQNLSAGGTTKRFGVNFFDFSQEPDHEYVELANTTDDIIDLSGWTLDVGIPDPPGLSEDALMRDPFKSRWRVPNGTRIAPKGYLLLGFTDYKNLSPPPNGKSVSTDRYADNSLLVTSELPPLTSLNGIGMAAGTATAPAPVQYVTVPPMADRSSELNAVPEPLYGYPLADETGSVFRRNTPVAVPFPESNPTAATVNYLDSDYIDNNGDGVTSARYAYADRPRDTATDHVADEVRTHGNADGIVPPWSRIVPMINEVLWWEGPETDPDNPYHPQSLPRTLQEIVPDTSVSPVDYSDALDDLARLVLQGGVLPNYPEHDGIDNDGDGGYVANSGDPNFSLRYIPGALDKDMVDNNLDGRVDERGEDYLLLQEGNPFASEGIDEGNLEGSMIISKIRYGDASIIPFLAASPMRRTYGPGSYEEGIMPFVYINKLQAETYDVLGNPYPVSYRAWTSRLHTSEEIFAPPVPPYTGNQYRFLPQMGYPVIYINNYPNPPYSYLQIANSYGVENTINVSNSAYPYPISVGQVPQWSVTTNTIEARDATIYSTFLPQPGVSLTDTPDWIAFVERRWNPGDCVKVTLYAGPAAPDKVADQATYRELDVTNRTVDDIVPCPYGVDNFFPLAPIDTQDTVSLDWKRASFWLPDQMGLDFYRSLERKHPLYEGDRFGTSNRWEATDGAYDDWSDSLSLFESAEFRADTPWLNLDSATPHPKIPTSTSGNVYAAPDQQARLFGHAMAGSPLRMNTQARIWENPEDLVARDVLEGKLSVTPEGNLADQWALMTPPDGSRPPRQFPEPVETHVADVWPSTCDDDKKTAFAPGRETIDCADYSAENPAYALRRAEVRNRPYTGVGSLLRLPLFTFDLALNKAYDLSPDPITSPVYIPRIASAAINTRYTPAPRTRPAPNTAAPPRWWRQDLSLVSPVLAGAGTDWLSGRAITEAADFDAVSEVAETQPVVLTVGQAQFRQLWPTPASLAPTTGTFTDEYMEWHTNPTNAKTASHLWSPVVFTAPDPVDVEGHAVPVSWLPFGRVETTPSARLVWDPPLSMTAQGVPYLFREEFLRQPVLGAGRDLFAGQPPALLASRWPLEERAVMYVSQHNGTMADETNRAESLFTWDASDGLENGTYIAYVATFTPGMADSMLASQGMLNLVDARGSAVPAGMGGAMPLPAEPLLAVNSGGAADPRLDFMGKLDPERPHSEGDPRFESALALEFITDPNVALRVAPPRAAINALPAGQREVAAREAEGALPHPLDWNRPVAGAGAPEQMAGAYQDNGTGRILYSASPATPWRPRLVRVTNNFLALRVRNLGDPGQVACVTSVILAPARRTAGKINVNTAEPRQVVEGQNYAVFTTLMGAPGLVNAAAYTNVPTGTAGVYKSLGSPLPADSPGGLPEYTTTGPGDPNLLDSGGQAVWPAPLLLTGGNPLPPAPSASVSITPLVDDPNGTAWTGLHEGVASLSVASMLLANRTEHWDGRYYESLSELAAGAAGNGELRTNPLPNGTLNRRVESYPLSNASNPETRFDEIEARLGRLSNLVTTRSDGFEIQVSVQAGSVADTDGDGVADYRSRINASEFAVTAESRGRMIYERRARSDQSNQGSAP